MASEEKIEKLLDDILKMLKEGKPSSADSNAMAEARVLTKQVNNVVDVYVRDYKGIPKYLQCNIMTAITKSLSRACIMHGKVNDMSVADYGNHLEGLFVGITRLFIKEYEQFLLFEFETLMKKGEADGQS